MRIALLPDEYLPSGTRVHSKMFHELALQLKKIGHHPIVITPGTPFQNSKLVIDYVDGIEVWRFKSGYTRGVGMVRRAINEWFLDAMLQAIKFPMPKQSVFAEFDQMAQISTREDFVQFMMTKIPLQQ